MSAVHRLYEGEWVTCSSGDVCPLPYHIPDITPEAAAALPMSMLLQLLEAVDPPHAIVGTAKVWHVEHKGRLREHRGYDLPAVIWADGKVEWFQYGVHWRDVPGPTIIHADGRVEYLQGGPQVAEMAQRRAAREAKA